MESEQGGLGFLSDFWFGLVFVNTELTPVSNEDLAERKSEILLLALSPKVQELTTDISEEV